MDKSMLALSDKQNSEYAISFLAASKYLFTRYKTILSISLGVEVVVVGLASLIVTYLNSDNFSQQFMHPKIDVSEWLAIFSLFLIVFQRIFLDSFLERDKKLAVRFQDLVDRWLFEIDESRLLGEDSPTDQERYRYSERYLNRHGASDLKNWYSSLVEGIPPTLQALVCQASCLSWDSTLRRRYNLFLLGLCFILIVVVSIGCLVLQADFQFFLLVLASAVAPLINRCIGIYRSNSRSMGLSCELNQHVSTCLSTPENVSSQEVCWLQDQLLSKRMSEVPVPDLLYRAFRSEQENEMQRSAKEKVEELVVKYGNCAD